MRMIFSVSICYQPIEPLHRTHLRFILELSVLNPTGTQWWHLCSLVIPRASVKYGGQHTILLVTMTTLIYRINWSAVEFAFARSSGIKKKTVRFNEYSHALLTLRDWNSRSQSTQKKVEYILTSISSDLSSLIIRIVLKNYKVTCKNQSS